MKHIFTITLLLFVLTPFINCAQTTIKFEYDESGHRDYRYVITLSSAKITADSSSTSQFLKPVEDHIGFQEIKIYPNPTKGLLKIDLPSLNDQVVSLRVHDSNGKLIIQQTGTGFGNEINLYDYPSGLYILNIRIGQEKKEWKIIKE